MTDTTVRPPEPPAPPPVAPDGEIVGVGWRLGLLLAGLAALGLYAGTSWLVIIAALVVMIFLHELGHFLTAKWSGMKVTEFFLFFGPKIWSFKRGETEYGIKLIPLGAYVRIIGMSNIDPDVPPEDEPRTYRQQSFPKRMLVITAGSGMHFLQALVLFTLAFSVFGVPGESLFAERLGGPSHEDQLADGWTVGNVMDGSAADAAGLESGDDILRIDGAEVTAWEDVGRAVAPNPGESVDIVVERDGREVALEATLGRAEDDPSRGFLGIGPQVPELPTVKVNPLRGAAEAAELTVTTIGETITNLGAFFTGGVDDFAADVADGGGSPAGSTEPSSGSGSGSGDRAIEEDDANRLISIYGVARIGADMTEDGLIGLVILMAMVNVSIGVLNLIPLLPLDGGHAAIAIYERIRSIGGRRHMADVSKLLPITYAVVAIMLMLGVSSIYLDIVDPIGVG